MELPQGAVLVETLNDLEKYQALVKERRALGLSKPKLMVKADPHVPAVVAKLLRDLDGLNLFHPKGMSLTQFFEADTPPGFHESGIQDGIATKWKWGTYYTNCALVTTVAVELALRATGVTDVVELTALAMAIWKGVLGPVNTWPQHFWNDNYTHNLPEVIKALITGKPLRPEAEAGDDPTRVVALEGRLHHEVPGGCTQFDPAYATWALGKYTAPMLAATAACLALTEGGFLLGGGALTLAGGLLMVMPAHNWSHMPHPPPLAKLMQNLGVIVSYHGDNGHMSHHNGDIPKRTLMAGERPQARFGAYDIATGDAINALTNNLDLDKSLAALVYRLTEARFGEGHGLEPIAWTETPALKAICLAKPEDRPKMVYEDRITRQEAQLVKVQARLEKQRLEPELESNRLGIEHDSKLILDMERQLDCFKNPTQVQPMVDKVNQCRQAVAQLQGGAMSALVTRLAHLPLEKPQELLKLQTQLQAAEAEITANAPFVDLTPKHVAWKPY